MNQKLCLIFALSATFLNIGPAASSGLGAAPPDVIRTLLSFVLKTQETSLEELRLTISKSATSLEDAIAATNKALGEKVLIIDGDVVKIDFVPFRNVLTKSVKSFTGRNFASNPILGLIIERNINERIREKSPQLRELIEGKTLPVTAARNALIGLSPVLQRNKRSVDSEVQPADLVQDMVKMLIQQQLAMYLYPFRAAIDETFDTIVNMVSEYYQSVPPSDDWALDVDTTQNIIVKKVIEMLTLGQKAIDGVFDSIVGSSLRQKRDAQDVTTVAPSPPQGSPIFDIILLPIRLLLDFIINPIRAILSVFTGPLNSQVKTLFTILFEAIYPTIGFVVLTPLRLILLYLIDAIVPCVGC